MTQMTTGQVIGRSLVQHGVDTLFGIPGAHMYDFNDAIHELKDDIDFIVTRHEQGAAYMAYGYAKSTGRVGAYTVVPGSECSIPERLCAPLTVQTPQSCVLRATLCRT